MESRAVTIDSAFPTAESIGLRYSSFVNRLPVSPLIARALEVAEKRLGIETLAKQLGAPDTLVRAWRFGHATMPEAKFLKLVDILTDLAVAWDEWNPKE